MRLHWPWTGKASLGLERQTFRPAPLVALYKATETSLQSLGGAPVCLGMGLPRETGCAVRGTPPQGVLLTGEEKLNCMLLQRFCCFPCFHHFFLACSCTVLLLHILLFFVFPNVVLFSEKWSCWECTVTTGCHDLLRLLRSHDRPIDQRSQCHWQFGPPRAPVEQCPPALFQKAVPL